MPTTRRSFLSLAACLAASAAFAAPGAASLSSFGGRAFASTWRVSGVNLDEAVLRSAIEGVIRRVDQEMSPWRADSAIARFNALRETGWQAMPDDACRVVTESLDVARLTQGAYDPTVGPSVARFGFGTIEGGHGRFADLHVRDTALRKADPALTLDLCGIAKGHALDAILAALRERGVRQALVDLGGEIGMLGDHPSGRPWHVAVEAPGGAHVRAQRIIAPDGLAVATSGHAANGYRGRVAVSHLIDPQNGRPASQDLASVCVLAASAMRADALATALAVHGLERGVALARRLAVKALFLAPTGTQDGFEETMTGGFDGHVVV